MNGADALIRTAHDAGIDICFANPGTTEIPIVAACDSTPGVRPVLCLFEGVCTGAADGYGRMAEKPALTLLHLGPGFANGMANLHNARRGHTPVVNLIGDHASWHLVNDPPLTMDIHAAASAVSGWVRTSSSPAALAQDMADAIAAARLGQVATLVAPNDFQLAEVDEPSPTLAPSITTPVDDASIENAAAALRKHRNPAIILGGRALHAGGLQLAARIRAATGCTLLTEGYPSRVEWGAGLPNPARIPYFPEQALAFLEPYDAFVLIGAPEPVAFFGYPNTPGRFIRSDQAIFHVGNPRNDPIELLLALAAALGAPRQVTLPSSSERPSLPTGTLNADNAVAVLAACQPDGAIIVNEGVTVGRSYGPLSAGAPPHTQLVITGGSIGFGIPCATGAAFACPDRPVIDLQADGSALYTVQALWTQAAAGLNITTLICSNRRYKILEMELARAGIHAPGEGAQAMTALDHPPINWVELSRGFGVPAVSVTTADSLAKELGRALAEPGPHLIEMVL